MKVKTSFTALLFIVFINLSAQKVLIGGSGSGTSTSGTTGNTSSQQNSIGGGKINTGGSGTNTNTNTNTNNKGNGGNIINDAIDLIGGNTSKFTQGEAASAIKEALSKGVSAGVTKASATDGFFKNQLIKILFPKEFRTVETTLRKAGMGSLVDNFVLSMNRAAENASKQAGPIFLNSIQQMNVNDAINIVSNQQPDAATQFLKRTTTEPLVVAFKPSIKGALDKSLATKYWGDITRNYNKIPFVQKVNTDLPDYVTRKAIDGLFLLIGQEEGRIRKDPVARTSEILKKVFGTK